MPPHDSSGSLDSEFREGASDPDTGQPDQAGVGDPITVKSVSLGAAWNIVAQVLPQGLTLAQSLVVGRLLGPSDQGIQSFMIFVAVTAATVFAVGLPLSLQRHVSESLGAGSARGASYYLSYGIGLSFVPGLMAAAVTALVGLFIYQDHYLSWATVAIYAAATAVHAVSAQGLLGLRQYRQASITGVVAQVIAVPLTVLFLLAGYGIQSIIVITTLAAVISAIVTIWLVSRTRKRLGLVGKPEESAQRSIRKKLVTFAMGAGVLVLLETVVAQRSELAFLAVYHGDEPANIAFYSVAFSATQTAYKVPAALLPVVLPTVTAMIAAGRMAAVRSGYVKGQRLLLLVSGIGVGFLLALGAPLIVALWGASYRPAGEVLLVMAVIPVLTGALTAVASSTLLGFGKLRLVVTAQIIAGLVTILCDAVLILPFGIFGAAVANSLGALASAILLARAALRADGLMHPSFGDFFRVIFLMLLIAAPGLILYFLQVPSWPNLAGGLVGGGLLLLVAWPLLRPLHAEDLAMLGRVAEKLPSPVGRWISMGVRRGNSKAVPETEGKLEMTTSNHPDSEPRGAAWWAVLIGAVLGLIIGLAGGYVGSTMAKPTYTSSTTYSIAPADDQAQRSNGENGNSQGQQLQLAELGYLTPVVSGRTSDADLQKKVNDELGHETTAQITPSLIPNSELLFQVQVKASTPQDAYDTATKLQEVLPQDDQVSSLMKSSDAQLMVVSTATEATSETTVPSNLIIGGGGVAGALLGIAIVLIYGQSRKRRMQRHSWG